MKLSLRTLQRRGVEGCAKSSSKVWKSADQSDQVQRILGTGQWETWPFPPPPALGMSLAVKMVKKKSQVPRRVAEARRLGVVGRLARASSLPLEAVRGTAGWRRAGVIRTAGAGRRSRRWLRGALAQAKEGQEAVHAGGGGGRCTGHPGCGEGLGEAGKGPAPLGEWTVVCMVGSWVCVGGEGVS